MSTQPYMRYLNSFKDIIQAPVIKQLILTIGLAAGVALGIVIYMSIQEPIYRPLDYRVTPQNMVSVLDTLDKAGIKYKYNDQEGVVYVAAEDAQQARFKLAAAGIPKDDGFNFSYLNDQNSIGNSQFLENARYLRALENDLSKTISAIEGVSGARVHIAIPQSNIFADENRKPTASVVLSMAPGLSSDKEKIRAIVQIVASSVPGLDPKDVAITDQYGHFLSSALDKDSIYNAEQLSYQNNIQNYYEKRIESMIVPLLGENKVSVRVYANIDYTQQEEAQEHYDPDDKVVRSEQTSSEQNGGSAGASGPPGSLANSPPESDSDKKSAAPTGSGQERSSSIKNYELGKSVTYKKSNAAKITALSVAVVVDNEVTMDPKTHKPTSKPVDKEKLAKITDLVKATIGYDEKRGDRVTVVNSSFNEVKEELVAGDVRFWSQPWFWDFAKRLIGILIGFAILYQIYKQLAKFMKSVAAPAPRQVKVIEDEINEENVLTPEMQKMKQEQITRLKELANREPNRVALVIKNWVGK